MARTHRVEMPVEIRRSIATMPAPGGAATVAGMTRMNTIPDPTPAASPDPPAGRPRLSIVIPVYNEEATFQELVRRVVNAPLPKGIDRANREIVCVNDASTDGTAAKLDELPALFPDVNFRIIHKQVNQGKGAALRDGFAAASG